MRAKNAVLLISPHHCNETDFRRIASRARELAPDVRAFVAINGRRNRTARWVQLLRPTLAVEVEPVANYRHLRGHRIGLAPSSKLEILQRLETAGLPVPRSVEIAAGTRLDPADWGPYVVVKPIAGWRGAEVRIKRTDKVRYRPPADYPPEHPGRRAPMMAQRFVYTGRWPISYRVMTFLGEPLLAYRFEASHDLAPLESPERFAGVANIVASNRRATVTLAAESDLLDLGRRIHAAVPERPVLGIDLVRDAGSGALFIVEVNQRYCWSLSSESGKNIQRQFGLDFYAQLGAIDRAAEALVRATRALAR